MADFLTDKEEIKVVYQAAQQLGIAEKLTSENPATKSGSTAELLMAGIESSRPDIAARLRNRAGVVPSLEAVAAQHGYAEMNDAAKQSLMQSTEQFVKAAAADAKIEEERLLASMSAGAERLERLNRDDGRGEADSTIRQASKRQANIAMANKARAEGRWK